MIIVKLCVSGTSVENWRQVRVWTHREFIYIMYIFVARDGPMSYFGALASPIFVLPMVDIVSSSKSQHSAGYHAISKTPVDVTDGAPCSIVVNLNRAFVLRQMTPIDHQAYRVGKPWLWNTTCVELYDSETCTRYVRAHHHLIYSIGYTDFQCDIINHFLLKSKPRFISTYTYSTSRLRAYINTDKYKPSACSSFAVLLTDGFCLSMCLLVVYTGRVKRA